MTYLLFMVIAMCMLVMLVEAMVEVARAALRVMQRYHASRAHRDAHAWDGPSDRGLQ